MGEKRTAGGRWLLFLLGSVPVVGIVALLLAYPTLYHFHLPAMGGAEPQEFGAEHLGQLGDFIGGMLNPVIAGFTFIGLLWTIAMQREELTLQRQELAESRKIAAEQVAHFKREGEKNDIIRVLQATEPNLLAARNPFGEKAENFDISLRNLKLHQSKSVAETSLESVRAHFKQFSHFLGLLKSIDPDSATLDYYRSRYFENAASLIRYGFVATDDVAALLWESATLAGRV